MRVIFALIALLALAGPALAERVTLTGEVTYRERISLPPGGELSVELVDLAAPDTPRVAARGAIGPGQVPLTFNLNFDDSIIRPDRSYGIVAAILGADGGVWFESAEPYAVAPLAPVEPITMILSRPPAPSVADAPTDAAAPAEPAPPTDTAATLPILNTTWRATEVGGNPSIEAVVSSLSIASDMRAGGRGGCNSWFAQAEIAGSGLAFSAVAATRMACFSDEANAQETAFFAALSATRAWRLDGERLDLLDSAGTVLAVLEKSAF